MAKKKLITIRLEKYHPSEMAYVYISGKPDYIGNYWDYHPGCHGVNDLGDFHGPDDYVWRLYEKYEKRGCKVKIIHKTLKKDRIQ